jgi:hypothetical protein
MLLPQTGRNPRIINIVAFFGLKNNCLEKNRDIPGYSQGYPFKD